MYLLIDTPCVGFISFFLGKKSVLSQVSPCQFSSSLHPDCEDGRGPAPGRECGKCTRPEILEEQAIAGGLHNSGAGASPVSHLHLSALLCSGKMHQPTCPFLQLRLMAAPNGHLEIV